MTGLGVIVCCVGEGSRLATVAFLRFLDFVNKNGGGFKGLMEVSKLLRKIDSYTSILCFLNLNFGGESALTGNMVTKS